MTSRFTPQITKATDHFWFAGLAGSPSLRVGPEDFDLPELLLFNERQTSPTAFPVDERG
jgi:hypothetical protein